MFDAPKFRPARWLVPTALLLLSFSAHAYIGPGAGLPVIGSLLAILSTIVLAIIAIVAWPVRKMLKKKKARAAEAAADDAE